LAPIIQLADLFYKQNRNQDAERLYRRVLAIRERTLDARHPLLIMALSDLSLVCGEDRRTDEAYSLSKRAVGILEHRISVIVGNRSNGNIKDQRRFRSMLLDHVALAYEEKSGSDQMEETFRVAQLANASSAAQAVTGMAARFASGNDKLAAVVRERQELFQRWQSLDNSIVRIASEPPTDRRAKEGASLRAAFDDCSQHLDKLDAQIASEFPAYAELSNPKPLAVEAVQTLLAHVRGILLVNGDFFWQI